MLLFDGYVIIQILQFKQQQYSFQMDNVTEWQHPFVDVFKKYDTFDAPKSYKGSVNIVHDPVIARKAFKISGSILSNNTVTIPDPNSEIKYSNLIGRYLYVELFASPQKYFCIHFQIGIKDREPGVRFTFTNMEKQYTISGGNTLKIPFKIESRNLWTIACIDIEHHLQNYGLFSKGAIKNYSGVHTLRGVQICSNLSVRGIYTSSNVYDWNSLPKQMAFKIVKGGRWEDNYNFNYYPQTIDPAEVRRKLKQSQVEPPKQFPNSIVQREERSTNKKKSQQISSIIESNRIIGELPSQSFIQLTTAFSFSSLHNPDLVFKNDKIYYSAGSILVRRDINTGEQLFMQGHTDYIVAMDSYQDWMVTVQEGAKSSVRIWIDHKCICSFQCPYEKVQQITLNNKRHLAMVGLDPSKRQTILVFDISQIEISRKPELLAKQISDFNILTIKFSPTEPDKLVSCGKQNIRFWRIKNQHLPGSPVVLNHHARNTIFTVLDFQYSFDDPNPLKQRSEIRKVYVGSQNGLLFQINYITHELEQVYKLHQNSAISSLVISSGFCVTGGQDQLLRVWQMDFSQYILEANNDGVVTSLTLSEDASQVACGTSTGVLSILDLTNNNYRTIVRSHTENVKQIVYHQYANNILSLSSDLTIRLWDPQKLQQTYQFSYPSNDNCLCLSANPQGLFFAAGFQSGIPRIFDIQNTCVIQEIKHHQNAIIHIEYSSDGRYLAVLEEKLNMLYSPLHSHQPIKHLPNQLPSKYKHSSFSQDSQTIDIIGDSGTHINLWYLRSLQLIGKIFTGKIIKKLKYEGDRIWAIFQDTSIRRYNTSKMTIEVQMQALHRNRLNAIDFQLNSHLLFSVGDDSFVKVWDYSFMREPHQVFIGHAKNINDVLYHNGRVWTAGTQGILVWNFKQQGQKFIEPPIFVKQKKAPFIKNVQQAHSLLQERQSNKINNSQSNVNEGEDQLMIETIKQRNLDESRNENRIIFSNMIKKTCQGDVNTKFVPTKIQSNFQPKSTNFKKTKKRQGKPKLTVIVPEQNIQNSLPVKHFFQEKLSENQLPYTRKIQQIKQHNKKFKLEYFLGIESTAHDHVVWNFMYGWYAYIYDNLIIIQSLNKARSQRIITMPEKLASLSLTKDYKKLICSSQYNSNRKPKVDLGQSGSASDLSDSSVVEEEQNSTANIYILAGDFSIQRKLEFHPRGIQSLKLSDNSKFIVTIGNFRQCTVCVWDFQFGKLKASSYTLQKLNDVSIAKTAGQGKLLQFVTVGRDQIHFWSYTKDEKLQYYDVFIKAEDQQEEIPELTSCDYLNYQENNYLFFGTSKGELGIVNLNTYKVSWRKKICSSELLVIKCCINYTLIGAEDGNLYIWNHNTNMLQNDPTPSFNKMNLYYSVNGIFSDQEGHEGIISTSEAIYYVNIKENFHSLLVGSPVSPVIFTKTFGTFVLTSHQNGRLKLWNLDTAEELKTYKWKNACTEAYFDDQIGKLVCFCSNQMVKLVNLKKFTKEQNYLPQDVKIDSKIDDYVLSSAMVTFGGRPVRWNFYTKGNVFSFDISLEGKKKSIKSQKVLELGYKIKEVIVNPEKNLIIAISTNGTISCYNVDYYEDHENSFSLLLVDKSVAQQFVLDKKSVQPSNNQERNIKVALSKVLNETYLAINLQSQCIYFRNYMKRITFQRLTLPSFPTSILLTQTKKDSQILVGLREGAFLKINTLEPQFRVKYEGIVNNSIDGILNIKSKNWIVLSHPSSIAIYSRDL